MIPRRVDAVLRHPALGVALVYALGIALRLEYTLNVHPPEAFISSDMNLYVSLARKLARSNEPLMPWDVTHPLGYPALLALLRFPAGPLRADRRHRVGARRRAWVSVRRRRARREEPVASLIYDRDVDDAPAARGRRRRREMRARRCFFSAIASSLVMVWSGGRT